MPNTTPAYTITTLSNIGKTQEKQKPKEESELTQEEKKLIAREKELRRKDDRVPYDKRDI